MTTKTTKTTYGIKYAAHNGHIHIYTQTQEWMSHTFVGGGGYLAKEWKTRKGAERAANRWTSRAVEVFTITDNQLNY